MAVSSPADIVRPDPEAGSSPLAPAPIAADEATGRLRRLVVPVLRLPLALKLLGTNLIIAAIQCPGN